MDRLCVTRAIKNAKYLQKVAPEIIPQKEPADGFGSLVPRSLLGKLHLAGPEQPPFHAGAGQDLRVLLGALHPGSEEGLDGSRRRGHLHMFHVKHPPDLAGRNV